MQQNRVQVYQEIQDDQEQHNELKQQNYTHQQSQYSDENRPQTFLSAEQRFQDYEEQKQEETVSQKNLIQQKPVIKFLSEPQVIDHQELGKYANLEEENQDGQNIRISITKSEKRGGIVSYYFVYLIEGYDTKGNFNIARRFNQFFEMRTALVARWPGCFVPSIPAKNAFQKNDVSIIKKRTRYLNDFLKKIAKLPHLYYSEEFQTLLRSEKQDVSEVFTKWPVPTSQSIINNYKEINYETTQKINDFSQLIKKNQNQLVKERQVMKNLAESYDKVLESYGTFFTHIFPAYEKDCFSEYCENKESAMLYMNDSEIKLQEHRTIAGQALNLNPFWSFYDLIRHQERDAMAFSEVFEARSKYESKKHSIDIKISDNEKQVAELALGKKSISTIGSKGTNDEIKYKLQVEIQELKRERENILIIIDIITAMAAYIQIERYRAEKQRFYIRALAKIGSNQINSVQNLAEIWNGIRTSTENKLSQFS